MDYPDHILRVYRCDDADVQFHPLHVMPSDALGTLPRPLLRLIYPAQVSSRSPSPSHPTSPLPAVYDPTISKSDNLSAAEKLREQMRRDMLSQLGGEEEGKVRFGVGPTTDSEDRPATEPEVKQEKGYENVDWQSMVSGTKRVLTMDVSTSHNCTGRDEWLIGVACDTCDIPHFPIAARASVLFLVRLQIPIVR